MGPGEKEGRDFRDGGRRASWTWHLGSRYRGEGLSIVPKHVVW
jgi:hypothetical protein